MIIYHYRTVLPTRPKIPSFVLKQIFKGGILATLSWDSRGRGMQRANYHEPRKGRKCDFAPKKLRTPQKVVRLNAMFYKVCRGLCEILVRFGGFGRSIWWSKIYVHDLNQWFSVTVSLRGSVHCAAVARFTRLWITIHFPRRKQLNYYDYYYCADYLY